MRFGKLLLYKNLKKIIYSTIYQRKIFNPNPEFKFQIFILQSFTNSTDCRDFLRFYNDDC